MQVMISSSPYSGEQTKIYDFPTPEIRQMMVDSLPAGYYYCYPEDDVLQWQRARGRTAVDYGDGIEDDGDDRWL